jgi:hypothetical protein
LIVPTFKNPDASNQLCVYGSRSSPTRARPGGHGVFCNNDPMSGWAAVCDYIFLNK